MDMTRSHSTHTLVATFVVVALAWATAVDSGPSATNEAMPSESISAMHARIPAGHVAAEPAPTF